MHVERPRMATLAVSRQRVCTASGTLRHVTDLRHSGMTGVVGRHTPVGDGSTRIASTGRTMSGKAAEATAPPRPARSTCV
jgi:hypothetical protein